MEKKARVLLINPTIVRSLYKTPCLGLAYVGASLKKAGYEVTLIDGNLTGESPEAMAARALSLHPHLLGVTTFTIQYVAAREVVRAVKRAAPDIVTVLGGNHASSVPEYVMGDVPEVDFLIKGEGEIAFPTLIEALAAGGNGFNEVPGLVFREDGRVRVNPPQPIEDLDSLEYPWQAINPLDYARGMAHGLTTRRVTAAPVISSRGCPYRCTYCGGPLALGRKLRLRDPAKFVDEIEYLVKGFGIQEVQIVDDNFTFYRDHAFQICQEMLRRGLDIPWSLPNGIRADRVDPELLRLMRRAGCYYLAFGIEFGTERMLKLTRKGLSLEKAKISVRQAAKLGYITQGFFMMGHPQEKKEDVQATIRLARQLPFDRISMDIVMPLPGTDLFHYYLERGYLNLNHLDWGLLGNRKFVPHTEFLDYAELAKMLRDAYTRFYLNPWRMLRFLFKVRSLKQIRGLLVGVRTLASSVFLRGRW